MRVSLLMTSYNRPERIGDTLRSLAGQTLQADEIIISDDCSPQDPTVEVVRHRHLFHQRFSYVRQRKNLGMPENLNFLLSRARGDIIVNVHDADEFEPTYVEELVAALNLAPDVGLAFTGWRFTDGRFRPHVPQIPVASNGKAFFEKYMMRNLSCPIWGTVAIKREVLVQHNLLDPKFGPLADVDYWAKVCLTHSIAYVPKPLLVLYPEGTHGNCWLWSRFDLSRAINNVNIRRHLATSPAKMRRELTRHYVRYVVHFAFGQLHLLRRARWNEFGRGVKLIPRVFMSCT
jgi:glycosyltransferase involved in cell wall biosynthesis